MTKALLIFTFIFSAQFSFASTQFTFSPKKGKVEFKTKGWPNLVNIKGKGQGVSGSLSEKENKLSGVLEFDLTSLKTGIKLRDNHMKDKYLQVKKFPKAKLTLKDSVMPKGLNGSTEFTGIMELHGVKKEVKGKIELDNESDSIEVDAEFPIKLTDFKIDIPSYKGITVAEKVTVKFKTEVSKTK